jgi:type IV pilus assembly protein PilC
MAFCAYKVIDIDGKALEGKCWCNSKDDLAKSFRDKGYYLVIYKELNKAKLNLYKSRLSLRDLAIFCQQFASLLSVGINIFEAISIIDEETTNKYLKKSLIDIGYMVRQGAELSNCMSQHSDIFPRFMVNMISIGEESGTLDKIFHRLSEYYNRQNVLKTKVMKAMAYPSVIFLVSIILVQVLFIYVIPIFLSTISELGGDVPKMTRIVLGISYFFSNNIASVIVLVLLFVITAIYFSKIDNVRMIFQRFIVTNTFTRGIFQKLIAVKFSTTLGILLNSGIVMIKALDITKDMFDNDFIKHELAKCGDNIKGGSTFSKAINELNIFPNMLGSMARIGEESGTLNEMLTKASNILEEELYNNIEKLTTLIEPMLIIFLSIFVGTILISLVGPMFNVMDTI